MTETVQVPSWNGTFERYARKFARDNIWRLQGTHWTVDDLMQEFGVKFAQLQQKFEWSQAYGGQEGANRCMMTFFRNGCRFLLADLVRREVGRRLTLSQMPMVEDETGESELDEGHDPQVALLADLRMTIDGAPYEVQRYLELVMMEQLPYGWWSDGARETRAELIERWTGLPLSRLRLVLNAWAGENLAQG